MGKADKTQFKTVSYMTWYEPVFDTHNTSTTITRQTSNRYCTNLSSKVSSYNR